MDPSTTRTCTICKKNKLLDTDHFYRNRAEPSGFARSCKSCQQASSARWKKNHPDYLANTREQRREALRAWRSENKGRNDASRRERHKRYRMQVLTHYSAGAMCCNCCGESGYEFLCIDHIDGGGHQHRKDVGNGITFLRWLINNQYPAGFQILCHNCNMARAFYGECPHKQASATSK